MPSYLKDGIEILAAFGPVIIGAVALKLQQRQKDVQAHQSHIEARQYKLGLFDKRFEIYSLTQAFLSCVITSPRQLGSNTNAFFRDTIHSKFLFGVDITGYLEEIYKRANELVRTTQARRSAPSMKQKDDLGRQMDEDESWFMEQFEVSRELFGSYMNFTEKWTSCLFEGCRKP
jgi:hypothetical protein